MDMEDFIPQYEKLLKKRQEQSIREEWLVLRPYMTKDSYISFEEAISSVKNKKEEGMYIDQIMF
jgi:hypothetical protein